MSSAPLSNSTAQSQRPASEIPVVPVALFGIDRSQLGPVWEVLSRLHVSTHELTIKSLIKPIDPQPIIIISGINETGGVTPPEVAQTLRMKYPKAYIFILFQKRSSEYDPKLLVKQGANEVFLIPVDWQVFKQKLLLTLNQISPVHFKSFRPVKVADILPDENLTFDTALFLPTNNKFIGVSKAGDSVSAQLLERMKNQNMNSLYVPAEQMQQFYGYTAFVLGKLNPASDPVSATEKQEKRHHAVRNLLSGAYENPSDSTYGQGREMVENCREIIKTYITRDPTSSSWYDLLKDMAGNEYDTYNHGTNVATYATLFGMGLGIGDPTELAMAGLFHDIGLAEVPVEVQNKADDLRTPEEKQLWESHPVISVRMLRERKIPVSDRVVKIILQHHEAYNGTGFPKKLLEENISPEARVLAIADRFDELTSVVPGRPVLTPLQAIQKLRQESARDVSRMVLDPKLLTRILDLFPADALSVGAKPI